MTENSPLTTGFLLIDDYRVDAGDNTVSLADQRSYIEPKAMQVLYVLACHAGETVSREQLMQEVWGGRIVVEDALTRTISKLRIAFADNKSRQLIQTVPKKGYRLNARVSWQSDNQPHEQPSTPVAENSALNAVREEEKSGSALNGRLFSEKAMVLTGFLTVLVGLIVLSYLLFFTEENSHSTQSTPVPKPVSISLALLPLQNLTGDEQAGYLADGIPEEIASALANTSTLNVKSRYATYIYANQNRQLREIAELLDAQFLLEGSVRKSGEQYRIVVRLIDATSEKTVWSSTYEDSMPRLYDIQENITHEILQLLVPDGLQPQRNNPIVVRQDMVAYQHYLKGLYWIMHGKTSEWFYRAEEAMLDAIQQAPMFAEAHGRLAYVYARHDYHDVYMDKTRATAKATNAINTALNIDPDEINARLAQAILATNTRDFALAQQALERVLAQHQNHTTALYLYSELALAKNDFVQALNYAQQALKLDPLSPWINVNLAIIHYWLGNYEAALVALETAISIDEGYTWAWVWRAKIYQLQGNLDDAIASMEICLELDTVSAINSAWLGKLYFQANQQEKADTWFKHTASLYGDSNDARFWQGYTRFIQKQGNSEIIQSLLAELTLLNNPLFSLTPLLVEVTEHEAQIADVYGSLLEELSQENPKVDSEKFYFVNVHNMQSAKALVNLAAKFDLTVSESVAIQLETLEQQLPGILAAQIE